MLHIYPDWSDQTPSFGLSWVIHSCSNEENKCPACYKLLTQCWLLAKRWTMYPSDFNGQTPNTTTDDPRQRCAFTSWYKYCVFIHATFRLQTAVSSLIMRLQTKLKQQYWQKVRQLIGKFLPCAKNMISMNKICHMTCRPICVQHQYVSHYVVLGVKTAWH